MLSWSVATTVAAYIVMPFFAGYWGIGDMRGPLIYPQSYHESIYVLGWEGSPHTEAGKPRVPYPGWQTTRPLFYGLPQAMIGEETTEAETVSDTDTGADTDTNSNGR